MSTLSSVPVLVHCEAHADERGILWPIELPEAAVRIYLSRNWMVDRVRAWHGHPIEWRIVKCIIGSAKVCALNLENRDDVREFLLTDQKADILFIPAGWANGWKSLTMNCEMLYVAPTHYKDRDDIRLDSDLHSEVWKDHGSY